MEVGKSGKALFMGQEVSTWDRDRLSRLSLADFEILGAVVNELGHRSAKAQELPHVITTIDRLRIYPHKLYIATDGNSIVQGFLKMGYKNLFLRDEMGEITEVEPLCCLDFYVHESVQRKGIGRRLLTYMLESEEIEPYEMAIDRPSPKLLGLMNKYYNLKDYIPQVNNFVVYNQFFRKIENTSPSRGYLNPLPAGTPTGVARGIEKVASAGGLGAMNKNARRGVMYGISPASPFAPGSPQKVQPQNKDGETQAAGVLSGPSGVVSQINFEENSPPQGDVGRSTGSVTPPPRSLTSGRTDASYSPPVVSKPTPHSLHDRYAAHKMNDAFQKWDLSKRGAYSPKHSKTENNRASQAQPALRKSNSKGELIRQYYKIRDAEVAAISQEKKLGYGSTFFH